MLIGIFNPMGAQSDRLRCEVCQNLILSPINTGFLRPAVATVLTVHGIETHDDILSAVCLINKLQQCLPFTVCAEGCETAEAQSDDEAHTLQVPE